MSSLHSRRRLVRAANVAGRARGGDRHRGRLAIPAHAHSAVRALFAEMNRQMTTMAEVAERSGVNVHTIKGWRRRCVPTLANLDACLHVLGRRLIVAAAHEAPTPSSQATGAA